MSRYYNITISPSPTSKGFVPVTFTTMGAQNLPNGAALQLDLDIFQTFFHQPAGVGSVILHGVDFKDLNQSANWNNAQIAISIGMSKGLPFANALQAGQIINGTIIQSFGNWQGNNVSLNLLVIPSNINPDENVNLSFNWLKGTTLESAIRTTLKVAYPNLTVFGSIDPNLVYTEDQPAQYFTLKTFCQFLNRVSKQIITKPDYMGVSLNVSIGGFTLTDGTVTKPKTTTVNFTDMIGNLTWIDFATIQAKLVMRADLEIGSTITFPKGAPTVNTSASYSQYRNLTSFDGKFLITKIRHVGSSRQPSADAWVTVVDCIVPGTAGINDVE